MIKTRCKFACRCVTDYGHGQEVELEARYDETIPEDQRFNAATPSGSMKFFVSNPAALGMFKPNQAYYIDITSVEPAAPAE